MPDEEGTASAAEKLARTLKELRMSGEVFVVPNTEGSDISDIIAENSRMVSLVMLGMAKPSEEKNSTYLPSLRVTADKLSNALFVLSNIPEQEYE